MLRVAALPDGQLRFRVLDIASDVVDQFFERVGAVGSQETRPLVSELM